MNYAIKIKNPLFVLLIALGLTVSLSPSAQAATGTVTAYAGFDGWIWTNPANGVCITPKSTVTQVINKTDRTIAMWRYQSCPGGATTGVAPGTTWTGGGQNQIGSFMPY